MDSLLEYIIILSIIWSFISSFISKRKKAQQSREHKNSDSVNETEINSKLIDDLSNLLKTNSTDRTAEITATQQTLPITVTENTKAVSKPFGRKDFKRTIKKRVVENKRLKNITIDGEDSFLHHTQHVLDDSLITVEEIHPLSLIGNLNAERIREAFILKEIIDKPLAMRNR